MNMTLMALLRRFFAYMTPGIVEDGGGTDEDDDKGGDRGDDFTPTGDDAPGGKKDEADKDTKDEADKDKKDEPDEADKDKKTAKDETKGKKDEPDEADKGKRKDSRIPLTRHQEILEKERERRQALEAELANLRKGQQAVKKDEDVAKLEDKVTQLEKDHAKAVTDGDQTKAAQILREIRTTEREIITINSRAEIQAAEARASEAVRYDLVVERMEEAYPQLNPNSGEFDKELCGEVLETKEAFELKGYAPHAALQKAIKLHVKPATKKQEDVTDVTPRVTKKDVDDKAKEETEADRKKSAVSKAIDAANKTPASTAGVGMDSDKAGGALTAKDVMKMSYDDFEKLDDAQLARMRGDEV